MGLITQDYCDSTINYQIVQFIPIFSSIRSKMSLEFLHCPNCEKFFASKSGLRFHLESHEAEAKVFKNVRNKKKPFRQVIDIVDEITKIKLSESKRSSSNSILDEFDKCVEECKSLLSPTFSLDKHPDDIGEVTPIILHPEDKTQQTCDDQRKSTESTLTFLSQIEQDNFPSNSSETEPIVPHKIGLNDQARTSNNKQFAISMNCEVDYYTQNPNRTASESADRPLRISFNDDLPNKSNDITPIILLDCDVDDSIKSVDKTVPKSTAQIGQNELPNVLYNPSSSNCMAEDSNITVPRTPSNGSLIELPIPICTSVSSIVSWMTEASTKDVNETVEKTHFSNGLNEQTSVTSDDTSTTAFTSSSLYNSSTDCDEMGPSHNYGSTELHKVSENAASTNFAKTSKDRFAEASCSGLNRLDSNHSCPTSKAEKPGKERNLSKAKEAQSERGKDVIRETSETSFSESSDDEMLIPAKGQDPAEALFSDSSDDEEAKSCQKGLVKSETFQRDRQKPACSRSYLPVLSKTEPLDEEIEWENGVDMTSPFEEPKLLRCKICTKCFQSGINLIRHITSSHEFEKKLKCQICDKLFPRHGILKQHIQLVHDIRNKMRCQICAKVFFTQDTLKNHILLVHKSVDKFECKMCSDHFTKYSQLTDHIKLVHEKQNIHWCKFCKSRFDNFDELEKHFRSFHNIKKVSLKCGICAKSFEKYRNLTEHISNTHEKAFRCSACPKTFCKFNKLTTHIKMHHENNRPYLCTRCPKTFACTEYLTKHVRAVHERANKQANKHQCKICQKQFSLSYSWSRHVRNVHGETLPLKTNLIL